MCCDMENVDGQSFSQIEVALRLSGRTYCPKCLSTNFTTRSFRSNNILFLLTDNLARLVHVFLQSVRRSIDIEDGPLCICERCGFRWYTNRRCLYDRYSMHLKNQFGNYYRSLSICGANGAQIDVDISGIRIYKSDGRFIAIPLDELTAVSFQKNMGPLYGWLAFRDLARRKRRLPKNFKEAGKDIMTIHYGLGDDDTFCKIYLAMKEIVKENKRAGLF